MPETFVAFRHRSQGRRPSSGITIRLLRIFSEPVGNPSMGKTIPFREMTMLPKPDEDEPSLDECIELLQHVNEALHMLGGAWQVLPGKVRARLVNESQRIEDLLDRAGALPMPPPLAIRDRLVRHLPVPRSKAYKMKTTALGKAHRSGRKPPI